MQARRLGVTPISSPEVAETPQAERRPAILPLLAIWLFVSAFNLDKAVHIDDPVHLYAARAILEDPLSAYSSWLLWGGNYFGQMRDITQPPLLFYVLAAGMGLLGEADIALHAVFSLFSLGAILAFYSLLRSMGSAFPLFLTTLFACGPGFIPSQNLMTDVPVLFFMLLFFCSLLRAIETDSSKAYLAAALAAALACLTKYVALILLPIFVIAVLGRGSYRALTLIALPISCLLLWSLSNYFEYGGVHLIHPAIARFGATLYPNALNWLISLGAIAPFSFLFVLALWRERGGRLLIALLGIFGLLFDPEHLEGPLLDRSAVVAARFFLINGLFVCMASSYLLLKGVLNRSEHALRNLLLLLWLLGGCLFIVLLAHHMAVRYVLVVLPVPLLALDNFALKRAGAFARQLALLLTIGIGAYIATADWLFADAFRSAARELATGEHSGRRWSVGTWGWQWYSQKAGMQVYHWDAALAEGDDVIVAEGIPGQDLKAEHQLRLFKVAEKEIHAPYALPLRSMASEPIGGYYLHYQNLLPYRIAEGPLARFSIFKVLSQSEDTLSLPLGLPLSEDLPRVALQGFTEKGAQGRWTNVESASFNFLDLLPKRFVLQLTVKSLPLATPSSFELRIADFTYALELDDTFREIRIPITLDRPARRIEFYAEKLFTPSELGINGDTRRLGLAIHSLRLEPLSESPQQ